MIDSSDCKYGWPTASIRRRPSTFTQAQRHHWKIDVGLGDFVDVVLPGVERDMHHDLDRLCVTVAAGIVVS